MSPAPFGAAEGVSLPSFYAWKRRLAAESCVTAPAADDLGPPLLPVHLRPPAAPLELLLPTGAVLRIPPGADAATVACLLRLLGVLPC